MNNSDPITDKGVPNRPEIFAIVTSGGAATHWLHKQFQFLSDEIQCFHGADEHLKQDASRSQEVEKKIIRRQFDLSVKERKVIGSIHTLWSHWAREACLSGGGRIAVVFRDPIDRALSLTRVHLSNEKYGPGVVSRLRNSPQAKSVLKVMDQVYESNNKKQNNPTVLTTQFELTLRLLLVFSYDLSNLDRFSAEEQFRYEDYVRDDDELRKLMRHVLPQKFHDAVSRVSTDTISPQSTRSSNRPSLELVREVNDGQDFLGDAYRLISENLRHQFGWNLQQQYSRVGYDPEATLNNLIARSN